MKFIIDLLNIFSQPAVQNCPPCSNLYAVLFWGLILIIVVFFMLKNILKNFTKRLKQKP